MLLSPWLCADHVFPSSTDLYNPAVCVPANAVAGWSGSKRTTHAPSMPVMAEGQVAPESVLRKTPRPWVAASNTDGWAGETAIDQTGRSGDPGCWAPVDVQLVSPAAAATTVTSNPAASRMSVSSVWRENLTWVPGKTE